MVIMEKQVFVLLLCVLSITEGIPISSQLSLAPPPSPPSSPSYTLLVPVRVLGSNGPQVVLVPVSSDWGTQRNQNPPAQSDRTLPLEPEQNHVSGQNLLEKQTVNSPYLQLPTDAPDTLVPEQPLPQGQILPPVWNNIPGVVPLQPSMTGQMFVPAGGQRQVVSVAQPAALSDSASSEEGDVQVVYVVPVSAELMNMGMMEGVGGRDANLNANLFPNPDPNPGHLQQNPTPSPAPSPALPAGVQEQPEPLSAAPPSVGAGQSTGAATTSCKHKEGTANAKANTL